MVQQSINGGNAFFPIGTYIIGTTIENWYDLRINKGLYLIKNYRKNKYGIYGYSCNLIKVMENAKSTPPYAYKGRWIVLPRSVVKKANEKEVTAILL